MGIEDPIKPFIDIFDNGLAVLQLEEGQAVHGTDEGITGTEPAQFQSVTVVVDVDPQRTALRMWDAGQLHFIGDAPTHPQ
ncbi:hypothetical protein D3C81_2141440 [compost metagenome]